MLKLFRRDPYFLLKYNCYTILLLSTFSLVLYDTWSTISETQYGWIFLLCVLPLTLSYIHSFILIPVALYFNLFEITFFSLLLIPFGVLIGLQSAYLMHNASHENIKPKWLNRIIGELCGLQQLLGFPAWAVPHIIHHQFPDDPEKDPHPPGHMSFRQFSKQMGISMGRVVRKNFFELWGNTRKSKVIWKITLYSNVVARYLRAAFLLILLGPQIFVMCYMASKIVNLYFYFHFNYATHRPTENNQMEVLNLDHNLYYWFINATMAGTYYHKNHHLNASLFDPRKLHKSSVDKPLITYTYPDKSELPLSSSTEFLSDEINNRAP